MKIKHLLLVAILTLTTVATAVAQAPLSFTYQAVVRNSSGRLVSNATVGVKISIVRDSATGQVVYSGVQTPRTNANGLFTLVIGDSQNGIDTITWRNGPYFLKSEVDPNGGTNYTLTSVQQMLSVPYALHAHTVDSIIGGVNFTERQVLSMNGDTVFLTGGSYVILPPSFSGNYNDLTNKPTIPTVPTNVSAFTNDAGYLTNATLTETQVLSKRGDTIFLTGGSFVKLPAGFSGNYNDLTNKPTIPTVPTNVSAFTNDAGYLTNATLTETQVLSIRHDTVFLTGGSFVKLPAGFSGNYNDLTNKPTIPTVPTNVSAFTNDAGYLTSYTETQVLSIRHDTVFLTGGSFVKLPAGFSGNYNDLTNKPTIPTVPTNVSAFTNDAGYLTSATLTETQVLSMRHDTVFLTGGSFVKLPAGFSGNYNDLTNKPTIPTNVSAFNNDAGYLTSATLTETQVLSIRHDTVFLTGGSFVKLPAGFSGNYNDLTNKPTIPTVPTNVSAFTNDAGYLTSATLTETQVLSIRHDTVFLTGGSFVKLPAGFSGNYNDLTNKPTIPTVPTNVSAFTNDAGYLTNATLTETQVLSIRHDTVFLTGGSFVKLPAGFSGNYNDLTNKPTIPTVPTNVSAFNNDAGYLTSATLTETQVLSIRHDTVFLTGGSFVKLPAGFSGNYNDLTNKPTIPTVPTNVSAFTNDAGYLTNATLTETQVLSKRGDTIFLTGGSFVVLPSETQNLSDVAANNDSVNSQIKNLHNPTDSMDAVNLRTLNTVISRLDSIITYQNRVIDTLRQGTTNTTVTLPIVTTTATSNFRDSFASSGGIVLSDGGATVSARGVCWSTSHNPTISDNHTTNGISTGSFTSSITGLLASTTYYVRAYATNSVGTAYGNEDTIMTIPTGSLPGVFSVAANKQVRFSRGNLQWSAKGGGSTATTHNVAGGGTAAGTWRFAEHQYDRIWNNNTNISSSYSGWIDLFGWATSGYNNKYPYMTSTTNTDYGNSTQNIAGTNYDWGVYNAISNGGNQPNLWRTLTKTEWAYLLNSRATNSGIRYAKAKVNGVPGLIIVPDNWSAYNKYVFFNFNTSGSNFDAIVLTAAQWATFESTGCVFLPAAGYRSGTGLTKENSSGSPLGYYWSSTSSNNNTGAYAFNYGNSFLYTDNDSWCIRGRAEGFSVRLVMDVIQQ